MDNSLNRTASIQAYFSHSYRKDDREVNLAFWKLFHENGFYFAIDPKSDDPSDNQFNITYLEKLMRSSDCFIAVVTRRKKVAPDGRVTNTHSPYIAFENFLAELAEKPRLVFIESGLSRSVFGSSASVYTFDRNLLETQINDFKEVVQDFSVTAKSYSVYNKRISQVRNAEKAGILIPSSQEDAGYTSEVMEQIQDLMTNTINHESEFVAPKLDGGLKNFIRKVSEFDFVILDICEPLITPDVLALIQTKAVPCVRLAGPGSEATVEKMKLKGVLKDYFIEGDSPVIAWKDPAELTDKLEKYLKKFNQEQDRKYYKTYEAGEVYFRSAGRRPAFIFISNPKSLQAAASKLSRKLEGIGISKENMFQYMESTAIPTGTLWMDELNEKLNKTDVFIALLNDDYLKSKYCQHELQTIVDRLNDGVVIQPYLCADNSVPDLIGAYQYQDLRMFEDEERVRKILEDIETVLDKPAPTSGKNDKATAAGGRNASLSPLTVLFLASNPAQTAFLNLTREVEEIDKKVRSSEFRDKLRLEKHFEQRPGDLQENLLRYKPTVVHFSGHGESTGELLLMDRYGQPAPVGVDALKSLFTSLTDNVRVIILNACYSKTQASAISDVIDFVVGMNLPISDDAAIAFSSAFYQAIAYGRTVQQAFDLARTAIALDGLPEEDTPQLFIKKGADVSTRLIS